MPKSFKPASGDTKVTEQEFGQLKEAVYGLKLETKKRHYARPTQIVGLSNQAHTAVPSPSKRALRTIPGPRTPYDILSTHNPEQLRQEQVAQKEARRVKTERMLRYSNSDNMKQSLQQPYTSLAGPKQTVASPKGIISTVLGVSQSSVPTRASNPIHRKGVISLLDGKPFYIQ